MFRQSFGQLLSCIPLLGSKRVAAVRPRRQPQRLALEHLESRTLLSGTPFAVRAGGLLDDAGQAVAAGPQGDVYVASKFQLTSPAAAPSGAAVTRYSPNGTALWTQHIFGDVTDSANAIAVDSKGDAYVTGTFRGVTTFDVGQVITSSPSTSYNGFIEKLDPSGHVLWVKKIEASASGGDAITLDGHGNVYTIGYFYGGKARFFGPNGQLVMNQATTYQASSFLTKQDSQGDLFWVQQFGVPDPNLSIVDNSSALAIAVTPTGNAIYVSGGFRGHNVNFGTDANLPLPLSGQGPDGNPTNTFVEKFDALGHAKWATAAGSPTVAQGNAEAAYGIALDSHGTPYVTGSFDNTAVFPGFGNLQGASGPNTYVAKLNRNTGAFVNVISFADVGLEVGTAIAIDQADHLYATGYFDQTATFGPFQLTSHGDADVYVAKLDKNLHVLDVAQFSGTGRDEGFGIAVDKSGFIDITGSFTESGPFSLSATPTILTSVGGSDIFVTRFKFLRFQIPTQYGDTLVILGNELPNRFFVTDDRNWTIDVAVNDQQAMTFTGIHKVVIETGNGDTRIDYRIVGPEVIPSDLRILEGDGTDRLAVDAHLGWAANPTGEPWHVDITGGNGADHSAFRLGGAMSNLDLEDQLGRKKNTVDVLIETAPVTSAVAQSNLTMNFMSGGGMNDIRARILGTSESSILEAALNLLVAGVRGDHNRVAVDYSNLMIDAPQMISMTGVHPDNSFRLGLHNAVVNAPLAVSTSGGPERGDVISGLVIINSHVGGKPVPLDGTLTMTDRGGPFGDDIRVIYDFNPQPEPPGKPQDLSGSVEFHVPPGDPWSLQFELKPSAGP